MHREKTKKKKARNHKFVGTDEAQVVVDYLNQPGRALDDPVVVLMDLTHDFYAGQLWKGQEIVDHINAVIRDKHLGHAEVHAFSTLDGFTSKRMPLGDPRDAVLSMAFGYAVYLHKEKLLDRIRRCGKQDCSEWFFAVLPSQVFHSDACRKAATSQDPGFRERRKRYMRNLRKGHRKGGKK